MAQFGSGSGVLQSILKENIFKKFEKNNILQNKYLYFFKTTGIIRKCHIMKFLLSRVSELLNNILNLASFASILSYISMCGSVFGIRIRIQEAREYGSRKLLNTDPIRIRIQNTVPDPAQLLVRIRIQGNYPDPQHCRQVPVLIFWL